MLGLGAAVAYALLGYAAQDKAWDWKKFLKTAVIGFCAAFGLDFAGLTCDVYTAVAGPTATTVLLEKIIGAASKR